MEFRPKKRSFLDWWFSFYWPFILTGLLICINYLFKLQLTPLIMTLACLAVLTSTGLLLKNLNCCSVTILSKEGVKIITPLKTTELKWAEMKEAIITKPGDFLALKPRDENGTTIYYVLSTLSLEDQKKIEEVLKEKTHLIIEELPLDFNVHPQDVFFQ